MIPTAETPSANLPAINKYAAALAAQLLDSFFKNHRVVEGPQAADFVPIRQVNLLLLKNLYVKWQQEMERLRSPYFDFEHAEVKEALSVFMNTLSQHIAVPREHFEGVLTGALVQTMLLAIDPLEYFRRETEPLAKPKISVQSLREISRYVQINKVVLEEVLLEMDLLGNTEMFAGDLQRYFKKALYDVGDKRFDAQLLIDKLNLLSPVTLNELLLTEKVLSQPSAKNQNSGAAPANFFTGLNLEPVSVPSAEKVANTDPQQPKKNPEPEEKVLAAKPEKKKGTAETNEPETTEGKGAKGLFSGLWGRKKQEVAASPILPDAAPLQPSAKPVLPAEPEKKVAEKQPVSKLTGEVPKKVLNETVKKEGQALNEVLQHGKIARISNSIPLNDQFLYRRELFVGEQEAYNQAVASLDAAASRDEAEAVTKSWAAKYFWDLSPGSTASGFMEVVERKFGGN